MKFITIADVTLNRDRICFYFRLNENYKAEFAAKQALNGQISSFKSPNILDIYAWLGFSEIARALFSSVKFTAKYKIKIKSVIPNELNIVTNNEESAFFFKHENEWLWTQEASDLIPQFGDQVFNQIASVAGQGFLETHEKAIAQQKVIDTHIKQTLSELKEIEEKNSALKEKSNQAELSGEMEQT